MRPVQQIIHMRRTQLDEGKSIAAAKTLPCERLAAQFAKLFVHSTAPTDSAGLFPGLSKPENPLEVLLIHKIDGVRVYVCSVNVDSPGRAVDYVNQVSRLRPRAGTQDVIAAPY